MFISMKMNTGKIYCKNACECAAIWKGIASRATQTENPASRVSRAQLLQLVLSEYISLRGGEAVPQDGLCYITRNTLAALKHEAQ